ncbi:MFS transporter [Pelosinus sp. UFO1]|uniref:MFS transporter n=1 Tax=Pelosinus sp. UFO1 TaxID=484770 RepID=UPI0004D0DDD3|nr:MFS transporter [Pelosinus sp. UFO1]AIF52408.1 protein of unknown function DUF894 DitE [Pelosinus sp. UFO1]
MLKAHNKNAQVSSLIHCKSYVHFWFSRVLTTLAYQMLAVAVGWQVYELTDSPFYLGLVGLAQFLPMFLLTLVVGHVADRFNRQKVICICQITEGVGVGLLAIGSYTGWLSKESIITIVFLIGAARAFEGPTMQAFMPGLVSAKIFPQALATVSSANQTANIIGPAIGGLLYAAGPAYVYCAISVLFLGASFLISRIKIEREIRKVHAVNLRELFAGITFIRRKPTILGAISLDLFAVLLGGATALLPIYAKDVLFIGPEGVGILRSAPAVGALLMSGFLAHYPLKRKVGRTMFSAVFVFGLATIVFALSTSFALSLASLVVLGAADVISVVIRSSLVQLQTPDEMRGRVSAVNSMFIGTSNQLGEFESGVTAAFFGTVPALLIGGIGTVLVVILWIKLFPELAQADRIAS